MPNAWLVRAGEGGRLFDEFAKGYVGVGYYEMGDMSNITSQEDMRTLFLKSYSDINPRAIGNQVAMIYKFRSVFAIGDKVVTYDTKNRKYWIGTIKSDYQYQPGVVGDYPNIRKVIWDGQVDRDDMTISSRNSLGCATTLFSVDEFVWQEFDSVLSGKKPAKEGDSGSAEETDLEQIRKELAEKAHEFIKDKILTLDADDMEELVAAILRGMGYQSRVSPKGPDRGVDVMASPDGLGLEEPRIKAEVKHRQAAMGAAQIRSFLGGLREGDRALYISTGGFSKDAKYEADRSNIPLTLLDLDDLASLVVTHYEKFDLEGRALIPLVRVYWPAD